MHSKEVKQINFREMIEKNNLIVILLIVLKVPKYSNDYDLFRVLERMFNLFDPRNLIAKLVSDKYLLIKSTSKIGINKYEISELGKKFIERNLKSFKKNAVKDNDYNQEYLRLLLKNKKR